MNTIYHIGTIQALFLAFVIFTKKGKNPADYILGNWFVIIAANLFLMHIVVDHQLHHPVVAVCAFSLFFLHGPFFFVYVKKLIYEKIRGIVLLLHFLPFVFTLTFTVIAFYTAAPARQKEIINMSLFHNPSAIFQVFYVYILLSIPVYLIWIKIKLNAYNKRIKKSFSEIEDINLSWMDKCLAGIGVVWIAFILADVFALAGLLPPDERLKYPLYTITVMIFFIGYFGFKQTEIFSDTALKGNANGNLPEGYKDNSLNTAEQEKTKIREKYKNSLLIPGKREEYKHAILLYMEQKKPFLNQKLTIRELSGKLQIPVNHVSQVINTEFNQNFFDFINSYRVEEFKKLAGEASGNGFTILSLAYEAGFSSKSSFNQIFKKHTNLTPTQYLKMKGY